MMLTVVVLLILGVLSVAAGVWVAAFDCWCERVNARITGIEVRVKDLETVVVHIGSISDRITFGTMH